MRLLLTMLFLIAVCTCACAQVGNRIDAEYASWCMVDSIGQGQVVRFTRLVNISTLDVKDIDPVAGTAYSVAGTLMTCEEYDLQEAIRDPLEDFYEDCQCEYSISQEAHKVTEIRGGSVQEWDLEFQEVVRRRCSGQANAIVVHRDTLVETTSIAPTTRLQFGWTFSAPGQYVDQVNLRFYNSTSSTTTISLDFNPNTVVASYPSLGLDPNDFSYTGSNLADMAAAYQVILNSEVPATTNSVTADALFTTLSIFTQFFHEPLFPYVTQPRPGDADYLVSSSLPNNIVALGSPGLGTFTNTSNYSEACEAIYTVEYGSYLEYDKDFPLEFQPQLSVFTSLQAQSSNETAFCDVSAAVCAELTPNPVTLDACVEMCSDVLNIAGHFPAANQDTTLSAATYNSISIYVTQGPVGVVLDGERINYPSGWSTMWSAKEGKLLQNSIRVDATGAEAIISFTR